MRAGLRLFISVLAVLGFLETQAAAATIPDCSWTLAGEPGTSGPQQWRGQVLYVDFWASWCAPCVLSFPFMNSLQHDYASKGLKIIAVDMDEHDKDAQAFLSNHKANFAIASGNNADCARKLGVAGMPSTFLISRDGAIRQIMQGFHESDANAVRGIIAKLLAEPGNSGGKK